jgi:hypothetical protein
MPFSGGNHGPETLALMYRALDAAWFELGQRGRAKNPGELRPLMARRIMGEVTLGETNVERLKTLALGAVDSEIDG